MQPALLQVQYALFKGDNVHSQNHFLLHGILPTQTAELEKFVSVALSSSSL